MAMSNSKVTNRPTETDSMAELDFRKQYPQATRNLNSTQVKELIKLTNELESQCGITFKLNEHFETIDKVNVKISFHGSELYLHDRDAAIAFDQNDKLAIFVDDIEINELTQMYNNMSVPELIQNLSARELAVLASDCTDSSLLSELASQKDLIIKLDKRDEEYDVIDEIAHNDNTPSNTLALLANDYSSYVIQNIASNPNTTPETLETIYHNVNSKIFTAENKGNILIYVTSNPHLPLNVITTATKSDNIDARFGAAMNPSLPLAMLEEFSKSNDTNLREGVALNPNATPEILTRLSKDENEDVRNNVVANTSTPANVLTYLFENDKRYDIRFGLSENTSSPGIVLAKLARDKEKNIRLKVTDNPNTPSKTLMFLLNDSDKYIQSRAQYILEKRKKNPEQQLTNTKSVTW